MPDCPHRSKREEELQGTQAKFPLFGVIRLVTRGQHEGKTKDAGGGGGGGGVGRQGPCTYTYNPDSAQASQGKRKRRDGHGPN